MFDSPSYIDSLLLKSLQNDDERALAHLFNTYYNKLYRIGLKSTLNSVLTEESIQLVFQDLWKYRHKLEEVKSFEAYLITSLKRRVAREGLKLKKEEDLKSESFTEELFLPVASYEEILVLQEQDESKKVLIQNALNQLTPRQKEVIILKYFEELGFKEIADHTGLQIDSVYKILHESLKKLRSVLQKG